MDSIKDFDETSSRVLKKPGFYVASDGCKVYYEIHGNGPTRIIFIAGVLTPIAGFKFQQEFFDLHPDQYEVLYFDLRGVGNSDMGPTPLSTQLMAADVAGILESIGWGSVHVVGISMGGMTSQNLALLCPTRIKTLTLINTTAKGGVLATPISFTSFANAVNLSRAKNIEQRIRALMRFQYSQRLNDSERSEVIYQWLFERFSSVKGNQGNNSAAFLQHFGSARRHNVPKEKLQLIRDMSFSKMVIIGTDDRMIKPSKGKELASAIGAELVVLEGFGHFVMAEDPPRINDLLVTFWDHHISSQ